MPEAGADAAARAASGERQNIANEASDVLGVPEQVRFSIPASPASLRPPLTKRQMGPPLINVPNELFFPLMFGITVLLLGIACYMDKKKAARRKVD